MWIVINKIKIDMYIYMFRDKITKVIANHCCIHAIVIPTPLNLMITSLTENGISLSWGKPSLLNENIMYYQVS